jgi:hypothetical protein
VCSFHDARAHACADAVLEAAAADLPATSLELRAVRTVLQDLEPSSEVPGVLGMDAAVAFMEQKAAAIGQHQQPEQQQQQQQQQQRPGVAAGTASAPPQSAAARLLLTGQQQDALIHIMSFLYSRAWLYYAPVSRAVCAAYIIAVHQPLWRRGATQLFKTYMHAAITSEARLDECLGAGVATMPNWLASADLQHMAGRESSWPLLQRLRGLGML